jgi:hypothetical protein
MVKCWSWASLNGAVGKEGSFELCRLCPIHPGRDRVSCWMTQIRFVQRKILKRHIHSLNHQIEANANETSFGGILVELRDL